MGLYVTLFYIFQVSYKCVIILSQFKKKEEINPHLSASVQFRCFSDSSVVKNPPAYARDIRNMGLVLEWGRSPGEENGNPLWYSCLENSTDRGA